MVKEQKKSLQNNNNIYSRVTHKRRGRGHVDSLSTYLQRDYGYYYSLLLIWMVQKDSIELNVLGHNYCMHCSPRRSRHLGKS